ncbi:MAG: purine-nucleoside phosphorylase [Ferruginibacter sp.]
MQTEIQIKQAFEFLNAKGISNADTGIVLGTGLHNLVNLVEVIKIIPYADIPHFPISTVEFHKGNLIYGKVNEKKIVIMQGRMHIYEGYSFQQIVFPIRVLKSLGIKNLLLSNAAGGINKNFKKGDLVLINDHINLQIGYSSVDNNIDAASVLFTKKTDRYNKEISIELMKKAKELNIECKKGIYAAVSGPNLETSAEYRCLHIMGADMVGMSTVPEVLIANQIKLPCAAVSVITDECDPDNLKPVNIADIIKVAGEADMKLSALLYETIKVLP